MRIKFCVNPVRVFNKYRNITMTVPCGCCNPCKAVHQKEVIERMNQESRCWKYSVFFTLTMDEEHIPMMRLSKNGNYFWSDDTSHLCHGGKLPIVDVSDLPESEYMMFADGLRFLSVSDIQKFMKRLRINIYRLHKKLAENGDFPKDKVQSSSQVRYYIAGEYSPTEGKHRPHYHGLLWFNSDVTSSHIGEILRQSWSLGFVDFSFATPEASNYVAKYINMYAHLPKVLSAPPIRPFTVSSRFPAIGSLAFNETQVRQMFFDADGKQVIFNQKSSIFENVRIWRYYQNKLFPKLTGFAALSSHDRIILYRVFERFNRKFFQKGVDMTASEFCLLVRNDFNNHYCPSLIKDYARVLLLDSKDFGSIVRWFNISRQIYFQSLVFDVTTKDYVRQIEKFYDGVSSSNLKEQMAFEDDFSKKYGSSSLLGLDSDYLRGLCVRYNNLSDSDKLLLDGFGVDIGKFTSNDDLKRFAYQETLFPENCRDYLDLVEDLDIMYSKSNKTRLKNVHINPNMFGSNLIKTQTSVSF